MFTITSNDRPFGCPIICTDIYSKRNNSYYFSRANQQKAGTQIYSLTQCSLTVNEGDWHILAGNDERINSHCLTRNTILIIDTSDNVWYNQVHWLIRMPYLSIIASNDVLSFKRLYPSIPERSRVSYCLGWRHILWMLPETHLPLGLLSRVSVVQDAAT